MARCQYTSCYHVDSAMRCYSGVITCAVENSDVSLRKHCLSFRPCPDYAAADEFYDPLYVGPGPWIEVFAYDEPAFKADMDTGRVWSYDDEALARGADFGGSGL